MNKITIEVDSDIQEAFERASEAEKQKIRSLIAIFFRNSFVSKNLVEVMAEIGTRAEARGLTPKILASILADEEENSN
ncbi:hypothetical protein [Myxosarcina sp. GI1]|uniref:hypothetical protein n=1 Tax=Myxosarcina sp. GI1 TaxID=1541065 RepID=UPI000563146F|nr:hypothetical protein [Myxosarcina sp. GI1]